jgi:hypothetical protein
MAIVAVQIADFQPAGIVLENAGLEFKSGDLSSSVASRHLAERGAGVSSRGFFGGGKLLLP